MKTNRMNAAHQQQKPKQKKNNDDDSHRICGKNKHSTALSKRVLFECRNRLFEILNIDLRALTNANPPKETNYAV